MTNPDVDALFDQPGVGQRAGPQRRTDGWVGGRADTWHGHYRVNPTFTNSIRGMEPADSAKLLARLYAKMYLYALEIGSRSRVVRTGQMVRHEGDFGTRDATRTIRTRPKHGKCLIGRSPREGLIRRY